MGGGKSADPELPVFDLSDFVSPGNISTSPEKQEVCERLSQCLRDTGCLVVRDPRVSMEDSVEFIDMMERYFGQAHDDKMPDCRPELHYQVGCTPDGVEAPRCILDPECEKVIESQPEEHKAQMPKGPDAKWRYFWRAGERPETSKFAELNAAPVIPAAFPKWTQVMDMWGSKMIAAVETVATMAAAGFGLPQDAFTTRMHQGPHLLAPTGSDLQEHSSLNTIFAGYHYDLNFLTIHGKSRFPGLFVWLRDGRKMPVKIPDGCLLLQAGKQMEWLTGGYVVAGMHEVICTEATQAAAKKAAAEGRSCWRVSSTLFGHIASDQTLEPLGKFANEPNAHKYPPTLTGDQVNQELEAIALKKA